MTFVARRLFYFVAVAAAASATSTVDDGVFLFAKASRSAAGNDPLTGREPPGGAEIGPEMGNRNFLDTRNAGSSLSAEENLDTILSDPIVDGIFWSAALERLTPPATDGGAALARWRRVVNASTVTSMEADRCGSAMNRLLVFAEADGGGGAPDGRRWRRACARYRINVDQIQGEVYSYRLARLLAVDLRLPPMVVAGVNADAPMWNGVRAEMTAAGWNDLAASFGVGGVDVGGDDGDDGDDDSKNDGVGGRRGLRHRRHHHRHYHPVVITPWLDRLAPAYIPSEFRGEERPRQLLPVDVMEYVKDNSINHNSNNNNNQNNNNDINNNNTYDDDKNVLQHLTELVQWSDLIVFDYLTANVDRVVNNLFNRQWNADMMNAPAHNLKLRLPPVVAAAGGSGDAAVVLLDNESGLFHSYRLLDRYGHYHDDLLRSLCVFRRETAERVRRLARGDGGGDGGGGASSAVDGLREALESQRLADELNPSSAPLVPPMPDANLNILLDRLNAVDRQMNRCLAIANGGGEAQ